MIEDKIDRSGFALTFVSIYSLLYFLITQIGVKVNFYTKQCKNVITFTQSSVRMLTFTQFGVILFTQYCVIAFYTVLCNLPAVAFYHNSHRYKNGKVYIFQSEVWGVIVG